MKSTIEEIRNLIAENEIEEAVDKLQSLNVSVSDVRNEIVSISAKQNNLSDLRRNNLLNANEIALQQNQLNLQILDLLSIIERNPKDSTSTSTTTSTPTTQSNNNGKTNNTLSTILKALLALLLILALVILTKEFLLPKDATVVPPPIEELPIPEASPTTPSNNNTSTTPSETNTPTNPPPPENTPDPSPSTTNPPAGNTSTTPPPAAKPDLKITAFQMNPTTPIKGQIVNLQAIVKNIGNAPSGSFNIKWWAGENFPQPAYNKRFASLAPGAQKVFDIRYSGYSSFYGNITSKLVIDESNLVNESDENNNVFTKSYPVKRGQVAAAKPDLKITAFQMRPTAPIKGQRVSMQAIVKNVGNAPSGRFDIKWWAGENYPQAAFSKRFNGLEPGKQEVFSFQYEGYPSPYSSITSKLVIDKDNRIQESNENNNELKKSYAVKRN